MNESDQKAESIRLLNEHGAGLCAQASKLVAEDPGMQPVGLILTADASEAAHIAAGLEEATGEDCAGRMFVGLVAREFALTISRSNAPATLDWLEPKSEGTTRRLPLIAVTKDGFRLGSTEYRVEP